MGKNVLLLLSDQTISSLSENLEKPRGKLGINVFLWQELFCEFHLPRGIGVEWLSSDLNLSERSFKEITQQAWLYSQQSSDTLDEGQTHKWEF